MENEINEKQQELTELKTKLESLENGDNEQEYCDFLDDCCEVVKIGTLRYNPSNVLKSVDEIAFNCGLSEYNDEQISELENQIKDLETEIKEIENL